MENTLNSAIDTLLEMRQNSTYLRAQTSLQVIMNDLVEAKVISFQLSEHIMNKFEKERINATTETK